jgi:hypothetical protein
MKDRRKRLSELHLHDLLIQTKAGPKGYFSASQPTSCHRGLTADYDAQVVEIKVTGCGTHIIPFRWVKFMKPAAGRAEPMEGEGAE